MGNFFPYRKNIISAKMGETKMDKLVRNFWIGFFGFTILIMMFNAWLLDFYKAEGIRTIPLYIVELIVFIAGFSSALWYCAYMDKQNRES